MPRHQKILVVAAHKEDTGWVKDIPEHWAPWVIKKGVDIPNVGREGATYFWAIHKLYDKLPEKLGFVQGNPFDHCRDLFARLENVNGYTNLGSEPFTSYADGSPTHSGLPVKEKFEEWTGKEFPDRIDFFRGCQFALTDKEIKQHPKKFYKKMHDEMLEGENPWVLERVVGHLWSK